MLACVLGKSGEIFFPKLGEDQMKTFSSICDDFICEMGYEKREFDTDAEAKEFAAAHPDSKTVAVVYSRSDTTGEKSFEEFYVPGEHINMERFSSLGVIENVAKRSLEDIDRLFTELEKIFHKDNFTKSEIVAILSDYLPNFEHEEKGKNLDQKM